jgi:hypothetical protein
VVDLLTRRQDTTNRGGPQLVDHVDVFEWYYAQHPEGGFEVFDE